MCALTAAFIIHRFLSNDPVEAELDLLDAARRMDTEALVKIFDLYSQPLYNYAYRLCNDAWMADQIVGDVFAKLSKWRAIKHTAPTILSGTSKP